MFVHTRVNTCMHEHLNPCRHLYIYIYIENKSLWHLFIALLALFWFFCAGMGGRKDRGEGGGGEDERGGGGRRRENRGGREGTLWTVVRRSFLIWML